MSVVAGIDCGTNSIRLLVADYKNGRLHDRERLMKIVRLGQGVDETGQFHPEALARTFSATEEYAQICDKHQVESVRFIATSASRDASNREEFFAGIKARLGVEPEVISGHEEASLSFAGAVSGLPEGLPEPIMVVDIGGGSTEFVMGSNGKVDAAISTNMGSVRLRERFAVEGSEIIDEACAREMIAGLLSEAGQVVDFSSVGTLVGVAGTVTTVTARSLGLTQYEPEKIDGAEFTPSEIYKATEWLRHAPVADKAAEGYMPAGRADVIGAGALIWEEIVRHLEAIKPQGRPLERVITSEHDILDGVTLGVAKALEKGGLNA